MAEAIRWHYWKAYPDKPPPQELRVLLELLFSGRELSLLPLNNKLPLTGA